MCEYGQEFVVGARQGWQCPICKRVYSPTTSMCFYCGNGNVDTITGKGTGPTNIPGVKADWTKPITATWPPPDIHLTKDDITAVVSNTSSAGNKTNNHG